MLKIKNYSAADVAEFQLRSGDDVPLFYEKDGAEHPVMIRVYGPGSKQYTKAKTDQQNRLVARLQRKGAAGAESAETKVKTEAEFLAAVTESMDLEYEDDKGQPLKGRDLFMAVYSDTSLGFVGEQVAKFVGDWGNFSKGSPKG